VIVTGVSAATFEVAIAKLAELAPAGTVTLGGTAALVSELERETAAPPAGAGPGNDTVPVTAVPPTTADAGKIARAERDDEGGLTVSVAV